MPKDREPDIVVSIRRLDVEIPHVQMDVREESREVVFRFTDEGFAAFMKKAPEIETIFYIDIKLS